MPLAPISSLRTTIMLLSVSALAAPALAQSCDIWNEAEIPNPEGFRAGFYSIEVISPTDVWAVGAKRLFNNEGNNEPLAAHYEGTQWTLVDVPDPSWEFHRIAELVDVDAIASDNVWAVGSFMHPDEADLETFVVHWDGTQWSWIESPTQANGEGSVFNDVEVVGTDDIWAVGAWPGFLPGAIIEPLAAHWDGSDWEITPVPVDFDDSRLHNIKALSPTDVWAIGNLEFVTANPIAPIIMRYDGSNWDFVDPRPPVEYVGVGDLAVTATDDVWVTAARWNEDDIFSPIPVFLHFDGSSWTEYSNPGGGQFIVNAPDDIRAVSMNAISHWDGSSWTIVSEMNMFPDDQFAFLNDIALYDGCEIWGAGKTDVADDMRTMMLKTSTPSNCAADSNGDGSVDVTDLLNLLASWGPCSKGCDSDTNGDNSVDVTDLLNLLAAWGSCP